MNNQKIPCIILAYYNYYIIKSTLDFLLKSSDRLDFVVLENKSENTEDQIKPYLLKLLKDKKISVYAEFEENISNNAFEECLDMNILDLTNKEKVIFTDGDLVVDSTDWLDEEINVMDKHPEVSVCGIDLKMDNLPVKQFPEAVDWIPQSTSVTDDYLECPTGIQLLLFRTNELMSYYKYMKNNKLKFKDSDILDYCYDVLGKKWVKTKKNKAEHLTWNVYADLNDPYTKYKIAVPHAEIWYHNRYCDCTIHTIKGDRVYHHNSAR